MPSEVLGLRPGDAHVIRNAGGIVTDDTIRSLAISQHKLGTTEIVLIHHTGCGLLGLDDEEFRTKLASESGVQPDWSAGGFTDLEGSVRDSIARIKGSPFIPHTDHIRGFVYELETGALREVA
jgi:carbonic anhydrase